MKHSSIIRSESGALSLQPRHAANIGGETADSKLIRILVLDDEDTVEQLESALWIWPHRISRARQTAEAIAMCHHLWPTAVAISTEHTRIGEAHPIVSLRNAHPALIILAIGDKNDQQRPSGLLRMGASAVIAREELHRPTLHDLLARLTQPPPATDPADVSDSHDKLEMPWRESQIIGALVCDVSGQIIDVNKCLAQWLGYPSTGALAVKRLWSDVLDSKLDWTTWRAIAGDLSAVLHDTVCVRAINGQHLWMQVQVFAAPNSPTKLQVNFIDQTELAQLTASA